MLVGDHATKWGLRLRQPARWGIGATTFTAITIAAGAVASLVLDQFDWVSFEQHTATLGRIAGAVLMIVGVAMVSLL